MESRSPRRKSEDCHWTCKYCGKELRTRFELRSHQKDCELSPIKDPNRWKCEECNIVFPTRSELNKHITDIHFNGSKIDHRRDYGMKRPVSEHECPFCHNILNTSSQAFHAHVNHCECNPDRKVWKSTGKLSEETRKKISESMKIAHAEGRAHNIGKCIWEHKKSYPEGWFTTVIENEFNDKDYVYNLQVGNFKLDFAWPKKMRYIEIDGDQHYRFQYNIDKDKRRSEFLKDLGWTELRLSWSYISSHKEECISAMKSFIDDVSDLPLELQYKDTRKEYIENQVIPMMVKTDKRDKQENIDLLNKILDSGVDFTKFKWKHDASIKLGISKRVIDRIVNLYPERFTESWWNNKVNNSQLS